MPSKETPVIATDHTAAFITRWVASGAAERANYQLFLAELCELLGVQRPDPATPDNTRNAYVFEHCVTFQHGDGTSSVGFIDLYKRGCFVLEAKQGADQDSNAVPLSSAEQAARAARKKGTAKRGTQGWDDAMLRARGQAEQYARALPSAEGRPPFLIVVDVGHSIELYSEFSRSGGSYIPYPDPRSHRIPLNSLREETTRELLRRVWTEPLALDPARQSARVTREIAERLARLALSLEQVGQPPQIVAAFLMRCLFTMFAEDVGLLPKRSFTELLESLREQPQHFPQMLHELWQAMNSGGFSTALRANLLRFNGGLFADATTLALNRDQIELLIEAARADWRHVEPAIFGTLLERALDPVERHELGAHYTPRAYVERLVIPTIIEPLRADWANAQIAAVTLAKQGKLAEAREQVKEFHHSLCQVRVLDPACGSGNFLYVTLEHLKRLEGEILDALEGFSESQSFEMTGITVDPHQLLGLEINSRAATIAEMVLWIGYLQWHYRTHGNVQPPEPVIRDFHNIEHRDAVLAYDRIEYVNDERGIPITRWNGRTYKKHPVTGEDVPDDSARVPLERYVNPRKAEWPAADFVVGNPPFIGTAMMRQALGDGYTEALRTMHDTVPESADFVMYWWNHAAALTRQGKLRRFGFITTNSLRQTFNRRILEAHLGAADPLSIVFAVPDHPWVDSADGAAVRIAMTVAQAGELSGELVTITAEQNGQGEGLDVEIEKRAGKIFADLTIGANVTGSMPLSSNAGISNRGMQLIGAGFIVTPEQAATLGLGRIAGLDGYIREYLNGRDLTQAARGVMAIDLFGLTRASVRERYPEVYQWVAERVKPERDHNNREGYRNNWWIFGEPRRELRLTLQGLTRYIATVETSKHRFFVFLDQAVLPDNKLICIALNDAWHIGILSSRIHVAWSFASGSRLGVGNDPVYVKTRCFETFPFPAASDAQQAHIRDLAEQLDAHRKRQQALHPDLTLTGMYNVLEKLRAGAALTVKERASHEQGLVSVLAQLHDELDAAVLDAYGWSDLAPQMIGRPGGTTPLPDKPEEQARAEEELLTRLVALNAERAREEQRGTVRWLRPEFQNRAGTSTQQIEQIALVPEDEVETVAPVAAGKHPWPKALAAQAQLVRAQLTLAAQPLDAAQLARRFKNARADRVEELLDTLVSLGQSRQLEDGRYVAL